MENTSQSDGKGNETEIELDQEGEGRDITERKVEGA